MKRECYVVHWPWMITKRHEGFIECNICIAIRFWNYILLQMFVKLSICYHLIIPWEHIGNFQNSIFEVPHWIFWCIYFSEKKFVSKIVYFEGNLSMHVTLLFNNGFYKIRILKVKSCFLITVYKYIIFSTFLLN